MTRFDKWFIACVVFILLCVGCQEIDELSGIVPFDEEVIDVHVRIHIAESLDKSSDPGLRNQSRFARSHARGSAMGSSIFITGTKYSDGKIRMIEPKVFTHEMLHVIAKQHPDLVADPHNISYKSIL